MKNHPTFFILAVVLAFTFIPERALAQGSILPQSNLTKFQRDSLAMEDYADSTAMYLSSPIVLSMTDTLFNMAGQLKNRRRQAMALSYKVDYYFIHKIQDSLMLAIDQVQKFSKEYDQPIYYYFAWQRKITFYLRSSLFNLALNELNLMQEDAIKAGYYPAQVDAYYLMGRIYFIRKLFTEAQESFDKAVMMMENAPEGVEIPNKYGIYLAYAHSLDALNQSDLMKIYLDKALSFAISDANKCAIYLVYCNYYLQKENIDSAGYYLKLSEDLKYDRRSVNGKRTIIDLKARIAHANKNYKEEIKLLDSLRLYSADYSTYNIRLANAHQSSQDYKGAIEYLRKEITLRDSIRLADIRNELSETMIMLDVNRIKAEKDQAEIEMKSRILTITIILSSILFLALTISTILFIKYYRTNKKLISSENNLCKAVIKLEEESRVKADFLRHLSHEVRTPLNSIVGFSHVLSDKYRNDPESSHCSTIIEESSKQLTKLIHDAVEIYNYGDKEMKIMTDINSLFESAINYMDIKVKKGVELVHIPCQAVNRSFLIDPEKTTIILSNLLHNAVKFTAEGKVTMETDVDQKAKQIIYTITDTGPGIPADKQKEVFDYFAKVDTMSQGLGLGLSLSRHLTESMGGTLFLDSTYKSGCRMILKVPY